MHVAFLIFAVVADLLLLAVYVVVRLQMGGFDCLLLNSTIKGAERFKAIAPTFFTIALHICLADLQTMVAQIFLVAPEIFTATQLYPDWLAYFFGAFDTYGYEVSYMLALLLTVSRFITFLTPSLEWVIFPPRRLNM